MHHGLSPWKADVAHLHLSKPINPVTNSDTIILRSRKVKSFAWMEKRNTSIASGKYNTIVGYDRLGWLK